MDRINGLADETICHILSFLPTQEAALTSVLSKRWRNLFALTPNLHLDDHRGGGGETFINFVDRVLSVSDNFPIKSISIKCHNSIGVDTGPVTRWMTDAAKHGVMNLDIDVIATEDVIMVPLEIFTCKTLVELKLAKGFEALIPDDVSFPSLKTLYLDSIYFYNSRYCVLGKILSASPVIEELTILGEYWQVRKCDRNISSSTLKKLTMKFTYCIDWWDMILDTPNLVYLEYCDFVPEKYTIVNLESLVKAKLDLRACGHDLTNLVKWLRNVEVLEFLSICNTWRTFCHWHEVLPVFINLFRLTITIDDTYYDWEFLPILLNKSPNLHTLVIKGPMHVDKAEREYGSSSVQVLKITEYGGEINELAQMMLFLLKLPCLELVKVRAYAITDTEKSQITNDLLMLPIPSMCKMQITFCEQARPKLKVSKVALFGRQRG